MPWLSNAIIGGSACPDASPMKRSPTTIGTPVTWQSDYVKTRLQWPRPSRISAQAKEISSPDNQARYSPPAEVRRRQGPKGDLRRAIAGREIGSLRS